MVKMRKSYRFRLYPNMETLQKMEKTLEICKQTYNELLSIRQTTYEVTQKGMTEYDMNKCVNDHRTKFNGFLIQPPDSISALKRITEV
jgi:transposase